jgi:organic radical activating enzyme
MSVIIYRQGAYDGFYGKSLHVNWCLTRICNYRCSYCFDQNKPGTERFATWIQLQQAIENLVTLNRPRYEFCFSGGEPTLHPSFIKFIHVLCGTMNEKISLLQVITNGSRDSAFYADLIASAGDVPLRLFFSLHAEYAKIDKIQAIVEKFSGKVPIHFALMFHPDLREYVRNLHAMLREYRTKHFFTARIAQLRSPPSFDAMDDRYTPEDLAWMDGANRAFAEVARRFPPPPAPSPSWSPLFWDIAEKGRRSLLSQGDDNQALRNGMLTFTGLWCSLGSRVLAVNHDGSCAGARCGPAFRASAGNIFENDPLWANDLPVLAECPEKNCSCGANFPIPKFRDKIEAEHFFRNFWSRPVTWHLKSDRVAPGIFQHLRRRALKGALGEERA